MDTDAAMVDAATHKVSSSVASNDKGFSLSQSQAYNNLSQHLPHMSSAQSSTPMQATPGAHYFQYQPQPLVPHQQPLNQAEQLFDKTGQLAPPGMKLRVTATLWEDESSLCFQVEARGNCVARREDNDMINGTKLLNVAGMSRGRRDGILKSEKTRHVVKIGPMHLKGVWYANSFCGDLGSYD